jgi:hypothetical protein
MGAAVQTGIAGDDVLLAATLGVDKIPFASPRCAAARVGRMGVPGNDDGNAGRGLRDMAAVTLPTCAGPAVAEMRLLGHVDQGA